MTSKEQKRSDFALRRITAFTAASPGIPPDMIGLIAGTPAMIRQNGFGQTMAYLLAKCDGAWHPENRYYFIFESLAAWSHVIIQKVRPEPEGFFTAISVLDQPAYLTLQTEALKLLQWLIRFARIFQTGVTPHDL